MISQYKLLFFESFIEMQSIKDTVITLKQLKWRHLLIFLLGWPGILTNCNVDNRVFVTSNRSFDFGSFFALETSLSSSPSDKSEFYLKTNCKQVDLDVLTCENSNFTPKQTRFCFFAFSVVWSILNLFRREAVNRKYYLVLLKRLHEKIWQKRTTFWKSNS